MPAISIVICCYNSSEVIEETLNHLKNQTSTKLPWEVVVVDNNSTDNTSEIVKQVWAHNPPEGVDLQLVFEPNPGLSNARLKGVTTAKYPITSFIDDDNHVPQNWINYLSQTFENPDIGILGCTAIGKFDGQTPEWYQNFQHAFATGRLYDGKFVDITSDGLVYGAGMSFRTQIYKDLNAKNWTPFLSGRKGSVQLGGEDSELCLAARLLNYRIFYTNEIEIGHYIMPERISLDRLKQMTFGFGAADVYLLIYKILYEEKIGKKNLINSMRKKWWFNFLGKKIVLSIKKEFISDKLKREIYKIRMNSFCETILSEKERFETGFSEIENTLMS